MKFVINENKKEKIIKSIRIDKELVKKINNEAKKNKVSFSKYVILACEFALKYAEK